MSVVDIKAPPEFDTLEVLAAAIAIYEHNKDYIKNNETHIKEDNNTTFVKYANRVMLRHQFLIDYYSNSAEAPPLVKVYDRHREKAAEIRDYTKKELFKLLNNQPGYTTDLYTILNGEYINASHFGYVASAPFYYENSKKKDFFNDKVKNIQSQHVGLIGTKVFLEDFEIIKINKSTNYPGYVVQGLCDGNLFLFFSRNKWFSKFKFGDIINIDGNVKDHVLEQSTIPMTKLNKVYERFKPAHVIPTNSNSNLFRQWEVTDSGGDSLLAAIESYCKSKSDDKDGNDLQSPQ